MSAKVLEGKKEHHFNQHFQTKANKSNKSDLNKKNIYFFLIFIKKIMIFINTDVTMGNIFPSKEEFTF